MKKKLNILTLSMGAGGTEKVISLLLPSLMSEYDVTLILFTKTIHFKIPKGVKVIFLSNDTNQSFVTKLLSPFLLIPKYKSIIKQTNPDISLSFLTRPNILNTLIKARRTKLILSERCFPSIAYKSKMLRYRLYKILIPLFYNKANIVFSNSTHINKDLKINFKVKAPLEVIYNPIENINPNTFLDYNEKSIDIIWIGKLIRIKNPSLLIDALHLTTREFKTILLGEGDLYESLVNKIADLNIIFEGKVSNVNNYINKSKVLILTSNSEGFPNVILEGMSYGLPVIATNCKSGPLELLNDGADVDIPIGEYKVVKYGILINVDDSKALSLSIDRVFNDLQLYDYLSNMSLQRVKDYSVDKIYSQLKNIL